MEAMSMAILALVFALLACYLNRLQASTIQTLDESTTRLRRRLDYVETREDGEYLAYRLGRALGLDADQAEEKAVYRSDCRIQISLPNIAIADVYSREEAKAKLNELLAKKHAEECFQLSEDEEKLIRDRREKAFDDRWVQVRPRKSKKQ